MNTKFLNSHSLPYCRGCGHNLIAINTEKALEKLNINPMDVILVTDIGCHGIIDKYCNSHTVHGLHGRSVALGTGISLGLKNKNKKVIVFIGDGGVTIGLQHILEAARHNVDLTVLVHNNMLYGMTGGQASGLTPQCFQTTTVKKGGIRNYDICSLVKTCKASYTARVVANSDFSDKIADAINTPGFSLIEIIELCPSYGLKLNKKLKIKKLLENMDQEEGVWKYDNSSLKTNEHKTLINNLFDSADEIKVKYKANLNKPFSIIVSGSAGEAVQTATKFYALAAMSCGLNVNQKGRYPVTVGVGFSTSETIISPFEDCAFTSSKHDAVIITSQDGLNNNIQKIKDLQSVLIIDESLDIPQTKAKIITYNFRKLGPKNAALFAIFFLIKKFNIFPLNALKDIVENYKTSIRIPLEKIEQEINNI